MKKIILLMTLSFSTGVILKAQDRIYGGIKIGGNYSLFTDKAPENTKSGVGFNIGYFEVLELDYHLNFQAEINYASMSFVKETSNTAGGSTSSYKAVTSNRSIEIPIMVKYRPSDNFAIGLGYQYSMLPKQKFKETRKNSASTTETTTEKDGAKTSGFFVDMNTKISKNILGLRVLSVDKSLLPEGTNSINAQVYLGFSIF